MPEFNSSKSKFYKSSKFKSRKSSKPLLSFSSAFK